MLSIVEDHEFLFRVGGKGLEIRVQEVRVQSLIYSGDLRVWGSDDLRS